MPPKRSSRTNSDESPSSLRPLSTRKQPERAKPPSNHTQQPAPAGSSSLSPENTQRGETKWNGNMRDQVDRMETSPVGAARQATHPANQSSSSSSGNIDPALAPAPTRKRSHSDVAASPAPSTPGGAGDTSASAADLANPLSAASKRREANRLAAARFRTRKKDQVAELEGRVAQLEGENTGLKAEIQALRLVAASKNANGEVPSYTSLLEDVLAGKIPLDEDGEPIALGGKKRRKTGDPVKDLEIDRQIEAERQKAEADRLAAEEKKRMEEAIAESVLIGGKILLEEENGRLKLEVGKYETTLERLQKEIEELRYKVEVQNGGGGGGGSGGGGQRGYGMMEGMEYAGPNISSMPYNTSQPPQSSSRNPPYSSSRNPPESSSSSSRAYPPPTGYSGYNEQPAYGNSRAPGEGRSGSVGSSSRQRNNWSLNLSNLPGTSSSPLAISSMRGMDSPVSAERSGARGSDEEMDGSGSGGAGGGGGGAGGGGGGQGYFSARG